MTAVYDTWSETVERLIGKCHESQRALKAAAEAAHGVEIKRLLRLYAQQRTRFAGELQAQYNLNGAMAGEISVADFSGQSDREILSACLEADERCLGAYQAALRQRVSGRIYFLVSAQYSLLQQAHARMRSLAAAIEPEFTTLTEVA